MALNYNRMRALATRLLRENGTTATLEREVSGGYDPVTDTDTLTVVQHQVNIVLTKLKQGVDDFDWQALRTTYEIGKFTKAYISGGDFPAGFEPEPNDKITIGGDRWTVKGNNPIRPDNEPTLHILILIKGAA